MNYNDLTPAQVKEEYSKTLAEFEAIKAKGLKLNMARGKPSKQQLDIVSGILTVLSDGADCVDEGIDARNYGAL
ncbi:MAG: aminotransferase, partial [Oscillospiraceae bacterium]|nr:aminotransferase [Oscillospiraceae bacterium]